jgi:hypothetical protein
MWKNSVRKKGSVILLLRSSQLNLITRLMLTYLGEHVESSSDFVFQKLYIQIIRRLSAYICICGDRSCHIMQEFNQKLKGPLSLKSSSSRRPLHVDLSKLEVSSILVPKIIIKHLV